MEKENKAQTSEACLADKIFVARQPIFDAQERPYAFELLYRDSGTAKTAKILDQDKATLQMITEGFFLGCGKSSKPLFINFTEKMLQDGHAEVLPPDKCVVEILEGIRPKPENIEAVKKLKSLGYKIALDDFTGKEGTIPWIGLADIVKFDILALNCDINKIKSLTASLDRYNCLLLAEKVESIETFKMLKPLGFILFQGFFFREPEIIEGKQLSSNEITRLRIMKELGGDYEVKRISELLHLDTSLSFRLFRYINSAGMGFKTSITTLDHAVTLLGQRKLAQWLRVLMLNDLGRSMKAEEVVFSSVHRGKFLELITGKIKSDLDPEAMFLLGMFSLLDVLLGMPMEKVLGQIYLDEEMKAGLIGHNHNRYEIWLQITDNYERQDWEKLQNAVDELGLEMKDIDACYTDALKWTNGMMAQ